MRKREIEKLLQRAVAEALGVERTRLPRRTISSARARATTDQRTAA
jgi:hypothetical protein